MNWEKAVGILILGKCKRKDAEKRLGLKCKVLGDGEQKRYLGSDEFYSKRRRDRHGPKKQRWNKWHLTTIGRALAAKTSIMSITTYPASVTPVASKEVKKILERSLLGLVWDGKVDRVKRSVTALPPSHGGYWSSFASSNH